MVQVLRTDKGTSVFKTIKQLMIFAAMLGFSKQRRTMLKAEGGYEDIGYDTFATDDSHDYIFLLAVAHSGDASILSEDNNEEIVKYLRNMLMAVLRLLLIGCTRIRI